MTNEHGEIFHYTKQHYDEACKAIDGVKLVTQETLKRFRGLCLKNKIITRSAIYDGIGRLNEVLGEAFHEIERDAKMIKEEYERENRDE